MHPTGQQRAATCSRVTARVVEAAAPSRLGTDFRWLITSSWATNLGDGFAIAAGPLLVNSLTDNPAIVGLAWMLGLLPWLLFGLHAGVVADRLDRRRVLIAANTTRAAILIVLASLIFMDRIGVVAVLAALFFIGLAEVLADTTSSTLLPMLVPPDELSAGNSRLVFGIVGLNELVGPAIGAALFTLGASAPFAGQAAAIALGITLISRLRLPPRTQPGTPHARATEQIADGIRWLWHHAALRTLAITIFAFNVTYGAAAAVLVVLATQRLGLDALGFGLLTSITAIGGVVGTIAYSATKQTIGTAAIMRIGLTIETASHLVLAVTTNAWPAMIAMFAFGMHASMWATTAASVRQAAVPESFQGRVASVYMVGNHAGHILGAIAGALLASTVGITAPYWFGFAGSALILTVIWRQLANIANTQTAAA